MSGGSEFTGSWTGRCIFLIEPTASHMDPDAPSLLDVLRVLDVPEALGMLAPRPRRALDVEDRSPRAGGALRPARRPSPRGWVPARGGAARHPRRRTRGAWPYLLDISHPEWDRPGPGRRNRSRVEGDKRTETQRAADILLRCFVDPTEARNAASGRLLAMRGQRSSAGQRAGRPEYSEPASADRTVLAPRYQGGRRAGEQRRGGPDLDLGRDRVARWNGSAFGGLTASARGRREW
jgi:hypothetical protein